jgi:hypothetical protein
MLDGFPPDFEHIVTRSGHVDAKPGVLVDMNADASSLSASDRRQGGLQALTH